MPASVDIHSILQAQLQERLVALGLPKSGKKEDLVARLLAAATPPAEVAKPQGREAAAAPDAAGAAPAGQPSGQGGDKGGQRRGGRLPPVAAVVAKKHEKDEIPAYPPPEVCQRVARHDSQSP